MQTMKPTRLLLLTGFLFTLLGAILPALMVLEITPSTLFLNFLLLPPPLPASSWD